MPGLVSYPIKKIVQEGEAKGRRERSSIRLSPKVEYRGGGNEREIVRKIVRRRYEYSYEDDNSDSV